MPDLQSELRKKFPGTRVEASRDLEQEHTEKVRRLLKTMSADELEKFNEMLLLAFSD